MKRGLGTGTGITEEARALPCVTAHFDSLGVDCVVGPLEGGLVQRQCPHTGLPTCMAIVVILFLLSAEASSACNILDRVASSAKWGSVSARGNAQPVVKSSDTEHCH